MSAHGCVLLLGSLLEEVLLPQLFPLAKQSPFLGVYVCFLCLCSSYSLDRDLGRCY